MQHIILTSFALFPVGGLPSPVMLIPVFVWVVSEFIIRLKKDTSILEMYGGYQYRSFCYVYVAVIMTINLMYNKVASIFLYTEI